MVLSILWSPPPFGPGGHRFIYNIVAKCTIPKYISVRVYAILICYRTHLKAGPLRQLPKKQRNFKENGAKEAALGGP